MRPARALFAAFVGTLVLSAASAAASPSVADRSRHAPAVPGARVCRERPGGGRARCRQRRGSGERPPRHRRARRPAREQRAALRRRARARRERQHERRAGRRGSRGRARVRLASCAGRGGRHRRVQRRHLGVARSDPGRRRAPTRARLAASHSPTARASTTRSCGRWRCCAKQSSRQARSSCSPTARTSAAGTRSTRCVAAAKEQRVRVFTVGLRSGAFDAAAAPQRSPIRPAGRTPRLVRRRSSHRSTRRSATSWPANTSSATAPPRDRCRRSRSTFRSPGAGSAATAYVAPTPSLLPPYHRSLVSRFLLSGSSPLLISLVFGLLICLLLLVLARRPKTHGRRPRSNVRAGPGRARRRCGDGRGASRDPKPLRERLVGSARA